MRATLFSTIFLLLAAAAVSGQARFSGKVVEVLDGRTMMVETSAGKLKTQLQYIETPEPDQPLHSVVKGHLENLALGKMVEFRPLRVEDGASIGLARIGGVDLSLQLIRDGAAWHEPRENSGQPAAQANEYSENQTLAKGENRGIWSIANLKTPWQLRAERKAASEREQLARRSSKPAKVGVNGFQTDTRSGPSIVSNSWTARASSDVQVWGEVFAGVGKEAPGLQAYSDPNRRFDAVYTPATFVEMDGGKTDRRVEFRLLTYYFRNASDERIPVYVIGFQSVAEEYLFSTRKSRLTIVADKRPLVIGAPMYGQRGDSAIGTRELFFYILNKQQVKTLGKAKKLELRIDGMVGTISVDATEFLRELADLV